MLDCLKSDQRTKFKYFMPPDHFQERLYQWIVGLRLLSYEEKNSLSALPDWLEVRESKLFILVDVPGDKL